MKAKKDVALQQVKMTAPASNAFDLSHDVVLSCNMAELIPVLAMDVIPGDRVNVSNEALVRMMPMIAPPMHRMDVTFHTFFVPNRLVWENWETFITNGGDDETQAAIPAPPYIEIEPDGTRYTRLCDFMGIPDPLLNPGAIANERVSALPFACYQLINDEYYRDQNLTPKFFTGLSDGDNSGNSELTIVRKRNWMADYFTKALPFAQKGAPVDIPLGDVVLKAAPHTDPMLLRNADGTLSATDDLGITTSGELEATGGVLDKLKWLDPNGNLTVDATTINDLRLAFRLQEWLEKNARGGTRYSELIRAHFGVVSPDARLQRPEYITGTKTPIQISEVLSTAQTDTLAQGNMAGHGVTFTGGNPGKYFVTEHGYIITIMSVMPVTKYLQGIPRHFKRLTHPTEYFWPSFANIGEQEIKMHELYAFTANSEETFGYTPRYQEYKSFFSRACTEMRDSLSYWHLARIFATEPALNTTFVEGNPSTRIFAVTDEEQDHLVVQVLNKLMAIRKMPVFGTPTF